MDDVVRGAAEPAQGAGVTQRRARDREREEDRDRASEEQQEQVLEIGKGERPVHRESAHDAESHPIVKGFIKIGDDFFHKDSSSKIV